MVYLSISFIYDHDDSRDVLDDDQVLKSTPPERRQPDTANCRWGAPGANRCRPVDIIHERIVVHSSRGWSKL